MLNSLYKRCLVYTAILLIIGVAVAPSINANVRKISVNEDNLVEYTKLKGDNLIDENDDEKIIEISSKSIVNSNEKTQNDDGKIRGCTITYGFEPNNIIGAKVVLEGDNIAKRVTYTGLLGKFQFCNVPLGWQYTVTVSHREYETKSKTVVLTEEESDVFLMFTLALKDDILSKSTYEELEIHQDSGKYGMIIGFVGTYGFPPPLPITGAKLVLEGGSCKRIAFSGPYGGFRFYFLEFERQYTITATHPYYQTVTKTITISADDPIYHLGISMKDKDESKTKSEEPACLGSIRGGVIRFYGGGWQDPIPFAKIDIGIRKTRANRFGQYRINFLPVNRTYTVTASAKGYQSETREITLTAEKPDGTVHFSLKESDVSIPKSKITENTNEPACLGSIWGNTGISDTWGFIAVGLVKVKAGIKTTYSSPIMGFYKIRNLPLGTYTVTGTKKGYDTFTETVKLTEGHPDKQVFVHMEPNDENVNKAKTQNYVKTTENNLMNNNGKISGDVVAPGYSLLVGVPGINVACGINKEDYVTTVTDDWGEFEFTDLPYENSGTEYKIWLMKSPGLIFLRSSKKVTLDSENPEEKVHFILPFVFEGRETSNKTLTLSR